MSDDGLLFAELKTTLRMRKVKSKATEGVKKELAAYALIYNPGACG